MTSEPKAPGAPAIILSYSEVGDATSAEVWVHVRLKILTQGGLDYGTITLPEKVVYNDTLPEEVFARTIHRDGTSYEFRGTPQSSTIREGESSLHHTIIMPAVEVGSILEYECHFRDVNTLLTRLIGFYSPVWRVQGTLFERTAQFTLKYGHIDQDEVRWVATLPAGVAPKLAGGRVTLELHDVPAAADEEMMPPPESTRYKVRFFYYRGTRNEYWSQSGGREDVVWSQFYEPRKQVRAAVAAMIQPNDTDEQKLHKIYAAVMAFENTDLTRARKHEENKKEGLHEAAESSDDLWARKRGNGWELTMLFVAMARAAGYNAYPMAVTSRDQAVFDQEVLSWRQMDSMVAIVNVKGRDIFFDPGTRGSSFAHMAPWHANVVGVSSEGKLMKVRYTPAEAFGVSGRQRVADVTVSASGDVTGKLQILWIGNGGLPYRLQGFREDEAEVRTALEKSVSKEVPEGVDVKLDSLTGMRDEAQPLLATFTISGQLGHNAGKRLLLPAEFFESRSKPIFAPEKRTLPIAFPDEHQYVDEIRLHLPAGARVESLPEERLLNVGADTAFKFTAMTTHGADGALTVTVQRTLGLKRLDYDVADYANLRAYFGKVAAADHEQVVVLKAATEH